MTRFPNDFRDFLEALRNRQVKFIVAGAFRSPHTNTPGTLGTSTCGLNSTPRTLDESPCL